MNNLSPVKLPRLSHGVSGHLVIHSRGGIGNQLFCFLSALARAEQLGCGLLIDPFIHELTPEFPFQLNQILHTVNDELNHRVRVLSIPNRQHHRAILRLGIGRTCDYREPSSRFDPNFFSIAAGSCVDGYFQSWKYLDHLRPETRLQISAAVRALVVESPISFGNNDIVIHLRRGDYLSARNRKIHGVLGTSYYLAAVSLLRALGFAGAVWVIAETLPPDLGILEESLKTDVSFVCGQSVWTDLNLLTCAPALILANSTFSWMGAWLGDQERPIIAPQPWFRSSLGKSLEIVPSTWIQLKNDSWV